MEREREDLILGELHLLFTLLMKYNIDRAVFSLSPCRSCSRGFGTYPFIRVDAVLFKAEELRMVLLDRIFYVQLIMYVHTLKNDTHT